VIELTKFGGRFGSLGSKYSCVLLCTCVPWICFSSSWVGTIIIRDFQKEKSFLRVVLTNGVGLLVKDPKSSFVEEGMLVLITVYLRITWFLVLPSALPKP
jgi:hypothetical protein